MSRSSPESKYVVSWAITKSTKHRSTNLVLPTKPFKTGLTICVDISSNPGPRNLNTSESERVVSNPQCLHYSLPHYNPDANNVYSSSFLHILRRSQLSKHIDYSIHTYLASLGILKPYRGRRGGRKTKQIEVLWIKTRPTRLPGGAPCVFTGTLYHPPSANDDIILDYLAKSLTDLEGRYLECGIVLAGEFNRLKVSRLSHQSRMKQLVNLHARRNQN